MKIQYIVLILVAVLLISGCTQSGKPDPNLVQTTSPPKFTPVETTSPPKFSPDKTQPSLPDLEGRFVGTWWIGKKEFKADEGGLWYPDSPLDKIALKADKTWQDDKGKKGTWSVEAIQDSDWDSWGVSWDSSSGKPEKKMVLKGDRTESGWIELGDKIDFFWLFFRFTGDGETPAGWIQLRFEKYSDSTTITSSTKTSTSQDPVTNTTVVLDLEAKLIGEWGFGTSRILALRSGGTWELIPEKGGSSGKWELKDVTKSDVGKWIEDGKISEPSEIASKKIVFYDRKCTADKPETEEVFIAVEDGEIVGFSSCSIGWSKL